MTKRKSGWYRVWIHDDKSKSKFLLTSPCLMKWDSESELFHSEYWTYNNSAIHKVDPKMVMTPEGELVYHQPTDRALAAVERYKNPDSWNVTEHDPLYNTQQEG